MQKMLLELKANRKTTEDTGIMTTFGEYNSIVGMEALTTMEASYKVDEYKKKLKQD